MVNLTQRLVDQLDLPQYQDQLVAVTYSCGAALIKAIGVLNLTGADFIQLVERDPQNLVRVQIFVAGLATNPPEQLHHRIAIPIRQICSIAE